MAVINLFSLMYFDLLMIFAALSFFAIFFQCLVIVYKSFANNIRLSVYARQSKSIHSFFHILHWSHWVLLFSAYFSLLITSSSMQLKRISDNLSLCLAPVLFEKIQSSPMNFTRGFMFVRVFLISATNLLTIPISFRILSSVSLPVES